MADQVVIPAATTCLGFSSRFSEGSMELSSYSTPRGRRWVLSLYYPWRDPFFRAYDLMYDCSHATRWVR